MNAARDQTLTAVSNVAKVKAHVDAKYLKGTYREGGAWVAALWMEDEDWFFGLPSRTLGIWTLGATDVSTLIFT